MNQYVNWGLHATLHPDNLLRDGTNAVLSYPNIGFSPDGSVGYVAWMGDLKGVVDTVMSPIVSESKDGGQTWSDPIEIDLSSFPEIADSLKTYLVVDSISPTQVDTVPLATGVATSCFDLDLTVDSKGNPTFSLRSGQPLRSAVHSRTTPFRSALS